MTQKEATGRGTDRAARRADGESFTFFALCLAVALFTVLQVRPRSGRVQPRPPAALQFPWHYTQPRRVMSSPSLATCRLRRPVPFGRERVSSECEETIEFVIVTRQTEGRRERRRRRRQRRPRSPRISQSGRRTRARERKPRPPTLVGDPRRRP